MLRHLLFLISVLFASMSFATPVDASSLDDQLAQKFDDESFYKFGQCGSNVKNLLDLHKQSGGDLAHKSVVLVLHELRQLMVGGPTMPVRLQPQRARPGVSTKDLTYEYHAFILADDSVYDFDFAPAAKPFGEYIEEMFDRPHTDKNNKNEVNILDRIRGIRVPAVDYVEVWNKYAADIDAQDPHQTRSHEEYARGKTIAHFKHLAGNLLPLESLNAMRLNKTYTDLNPEKYVYHGRFQNSDAPSHAECQGMFDAGDYEATAHFLDSNPYVSVLHFLSVDRDAKGTFDNLSFTGRLGGSGDVIYEKTTTLPPDRSRRYRLEGLIDSNVLALKVAVVVWNTRTDRQVCTTRGEFFGSN